MKLLMVLFMAGSLYAGSLGKVCTTTNLVNSQQTLDLCVTVGRVNNELLAKQEIVLITSSVTFKDVSTREGKVNLINRISHSLGKAEVYLDSFHIR